MEEKLTKKELKGLRKTQRLEEKKEFKTKNMIKRISIWLGLTVILIASVWGLIALANKQPSSVLPAQTANIKPVSNEDIKIGNPTANAVLIEYSDFQCPACKTYHPIVEQVLSEYKDRLLFIYRNFPLPQHKNAVISAQAAYSAHLQGKFLEMSKIIFENQNAWKDESNPTEKFVSYAQTIGLDIDQFKKDLDSQKTFGFVKDQEKEAQNAEINQTPTFFLNGIQISPRSFEEFKKLIERDLSLIDEINRSAK